MVVLFIVIANAVLKCYGARFCEEVAAQELIRLWEIGLVEVMFEGSIGGVVIKVYRKIKDKMIKPRDDMDVILKG